MSVIGIFPVGFLIVSEGGKEIRSDSPLASGTKLIELSCVKSFFQL